MDPMVQSHIKKLDCWSNIP